ncbi:bifunctional 3-(3-hydroxy-phenyl)propionate/3-hydroxycinnamic acid hydroxylase [Nocardia higoensis]|uniref:bifunctional 3-(3-hydroxy-phenyl)propionate/3-hydroxycinnamic acid hydroxylase n=1 Tax=Nocardia higoensis TaxID=228599 RepID=UPI0002F261E3|nr:bifunctional 3-(3-hydroxy-phenyl)propionate/3-hydroxycinnamic acid hydroxylase [Nocardia higoensis]
MDTQVLVVGAGPCGVTIANLLGVYGVRTILIDRAPDVIDYPRGVGVDDESLRVFQACGLGKQVHADMVQNQALIWFDSNRTKIAEVAPAGQPFGWPRRNSFLQPMLEKTMRGGLSRFPHVELRTETELLDLTQDASGVRATITGPDGKQEILDASYVIGADGGKSTVRKLMGSSLEGHTLAARWLVVDIKGSTYHAPFSGNYISSDRPHVSIDLPYGYRRFEFRLRDDETDEQMMQPAAVERLIRSHFDWTGPMPGLERTRIYSHHSRVANRFGNGRIFIAGDAAHLQPPWFGQGMNSGIRDAANIAWKIAAVLEHGADGSILQTYDTERRGHAQAMVELATTLGRIYSPKNKFGERVRSVGLRALQYLPGARDYLLQMKFKPMPYYEKGIVLNPDPREPIGRMVIQPHVETETGERVPLDTALGDWFAVVGINVDPAEHLSEESLNYWKSLGAGIFRINRSRAGEHMRRVRPGTVLLDDVAGGFRDWTARRTDREILVIRPDRYLAAMSSRDAADAMTSGFAELLPVRATVNH